MKEKSYKTLIVDGNSLLKNCFGATYKYRNDWSHPHIHAVYTFLMRVRNQLAVGNYNRLRITFDGDSKGILRQRVYADYKKSRKAPVDPTPEKILETESFNIQKQKLQDYLSYFCYWYQDLEVEADDVIAQLVYTKKPKEKQTIMTGDVDIMQLIEKNVEIFYLNKTFKTKTPAVKTYMKNPNRKPLIINHKNFKKYFGYCHENITTIKTICGDSSDDIANIYRVGEKSLLNEFPELTNKAVVVEEILKTCAAEFESKTIGQTRRTLLTSIHQRKTNGLQGKEIIEINKRLVTLSNEEFISTVCMANIKNSGFLSHDKFTADNSPIMVKKMQDDGLYEHIQKNYNSLKYFFKPFKRTLL